jgi:hypothetical protein
MSVRYDPNEITSLDAAMSFSLHVGRYGRRASEFHCWVKEPFYETDSTVVE